MTAKQQIAEAIRELTKFREVRPRDEKDDSEELLNSAKIKEGELNAASAPAPPPPPAPSGSPSAAPNADAGAPAAVDAGAPRPPPASPPANGGGDAGAAPAN
jgi:hypothetical protein